MKEFFGLREALYHRRKDFLLAKLRKDLVMIDSKVRFIMAIINDELVVNKVKKKIIVAKLKAMGFKTQTEINEILPEKKKATVANDMEESKIEEEEEVVAAGEIRSSEYDYLLSMSIVSLTEEKVAQLQ